MLRCTVCERELYDMTDSLFCEFCYTPFHRSCIAEHIHTIRICPVCKKEISLIDHQYKPLNTVTRPYPEKIRKPRWPQVEEVPLFEEERTIPPLPASGYIPVYTRKGAGARWKTLASQYLQKGTLKEFKKNRKARLGLYMLSAAVVIAVLAPVLILYDPVIYMAEDDYVYHPPTMKYPMGTDVFGRDIYSQTIWGFRSALIIALPSAVLVGVIGTVVGLTSGYYGGIVDAILQRISLTFLVWPSVPLVALIVFSWGPHRALPAVILGVAFTLWPTTSRAIRAEVLSLKVRPFIESAKVAGASSRRIVFRHILPRVVHISFLYMTIAVASALVLEATFNFLGLTSPAVITWGQMLSFTYHASGARFAIGGGIVWWTILPPASAITYMVLSFFLVSTGLRESMKITTVGF